MVHQPQTARQCLHHLEGEERSPRDQCGETFFVDFDDFAIYQRIYGCAAGLALLYKTHLADNPPWSDIFEDNTAAADLQ